MNTDTTRQDIPPRALGCGYDVPATGAPEQVQAHERAADVILDDLFMSVGQAIGLRATVDYDAVVWLRNHFRQKFPGGAASPG